MYIFFQTADTILLEICKFLPLKSAAEQMFVSHDQLDLFSVFCPVQRTGTKSGHDLLKVRKSVTFIYFGIQIMTTFCACVCMGQNTENKSNWSWEGNSVQPPTLPCKISSAQMLTDFLNVLLW